MLAVWEEFEREPSSLCPRLVFFSTAILLCCLSFGSLLCAFDLALHPLLLTLFGALTIPFWADSLSLSSVCRLSVPFFPVFLLYRLGSVRLGSC